MHACVCVCVHVCVVRGLVLGSSVWGSQVLSSSCLGLRADSPPLPRGTSLTGWVQRRGPCGLCPDLILLPLTRRHDAPRSSPRRAGSRAAQLAHPSGRLCLRRHPPRYCDVHPCWLRCLHSTEGLSLPTGGRGLTSPTSSPSLLSSYEESSTPKEVPAASKDGLTDGEKKEK